MTTNEQITPVEDRLTRARTYVEHSHAKNTLHAYAADWKHFTIWCEQHNRSSQSTSW